ncbi:MAG: molybdenum cofactor guanylyltransferase [Planctomycetes bacterium]|nr:molybdenum cofactor guanylyltransferase [Planctomycetota bacterium]
MSADRPCGLILCGGASSRMRQDKATLPFGGETLIERMVRIVGSATSRVVVVAAPGQALPALPPAVQVVHDRTPGRGPLEGLAAGLRALGDDQAVAFATSCDAPLLRAEWIERVSSLLGAHDCAVPFIGGFYQPLAAAYRARVLPQIEQALTAEQRSIWRLLNQLDTRQIAAEELRDVDPGLDSLRNCNTWEEYREMLSDE